jgi:hypothetical protein
MSTTPYSKVFDVVTKLIGNESEGEYTASPSTSSNKGTSTAPSKPFKAVAANKSLREVLLSAGYKSGTFVFELAAVIGTKEGYQKGSTNRPSRNNNPGNLTGTSYTDIDANVVLEPKNAKGERRFAKFSTPELGAKALVERKIKSWANGNYPGTIVNAPSKSKDANEYRSTWKVPNSLVDLSGKKVNITIEQFFYIYAPPSENNTEGYISSVLATLKKTYPEIKKTSRLIDYINK